MNWAIKQQFVILVLCKKSQGINVSIASLNALDRAKSIAQINVNSCIKVNKGI